jgi:DOPA 4,5-dioxygenase
MLNSEIAQNSLNLPVGYARDFDAHVYYDAESRGRAERLREAALQEFNAAPVLVGQLVDRKMGPHPTPMFELNFPNRCLGEILQWFMKHRQGLSVLVHQVTGDDPWDHSEGALWLGRQLELDSSKLDPSPSHSAND